MDTVYDVESHPLLGDPKGKFQSLEDPEEQQAIVQIAEALLRINQETQDDGEDATMKNAVALQVNFLLDQGMTPQFALQTNQSQPGLSTTFRSRWLDPRAAALVSRVLGIEQVRFTPPMFGV